MSFGTGEQALDIDLQPGLNVFVGPNGGGKSNILRGLGFVLQHFSDLLPGFRQSAPFLPPHKPVDPTAHTRLVCEIEWDTPDEWQLWTAFLIGALVPRRDWSLRNIFETPTSEPFPFDGDRLNQYLQAVSQLDFSSAVSLFAHQNLIVDVDPTTHRCELKCRFPKLHADLDATGSGYLHLSDKLPTGPAVSLAELYVRTFKPEMQERWSGFWRGAEDLPSLPALDWECLKGLRDGESAALHAFEGTYQLRLDLPSTVVPLQRVPRNEQIGTELRWGSAVATLLQESYVHWDRWEVMDPAPWEHGAPLAYHLRRGELGPALLTLAARGWTGQNAYQEVCREFQELTGTSLAYRIEDPPLQSPGESDHPPILVTADTTADIPIGQAGSGRAQIAMLLLMLRSRGAVLALDEPEHALHPMLQARLAEQWHGTGAQTLVATHSPWLVPMSRLDRVRHIMLNPETGCSRVSPGPRAGDEASHGTRITRSVLAKQVRYPGDGIWLFAPIVVLVEGVNDAAALSVWFDKWVSVSNGERGTHWSAGTCFWPSGGKTAIMPFSRILDHFEIPWVALFDADCLARDGEAPKRLTRDNKPVWEAWREAGFLPVTPDDLSNYSWADRHALYPLKREGQTGQIFLRGTRAKDNLDTLSEVLMNKKVAQSEVTGGPNMYRWIADQTPCPREFHELFKAVRKRCCQRRDGSPLSAGMPPV